MIAIAKMPAERRAELFSATARKMRLPEAIVEKDFWVCYVLDMIFDRSPFRESVVFKGGTSLSKGFGLIQRFSEDVDLILDWRLLGYGTNEPWEERSNTKQEKFKQETIDRTERFLSDEFVPAFKSTVERDLGMTPVVYPGDDEETVVFEYPRVFSSKATLDAIRLEIGPLAAWTPSSPVSIAPYAAEHFPRLFERPATTVATADPARTFWEKATILHQEANRPEGKAMPKRYARHYYDLYRLGHSPVLDEALGSPDLLARVVAFKEKFYRTPWARLSEAKPGTLRLAPQPERLGELEADYDAMRDMLFGDVPEFGSIVSYMGELESVINGAAPRA